MYEDTQSENGARLISAARDLAPVLAERAADTAAARRLPVETVEDLRKAGFMAALVPRRFGGLGLGLDEIVEATIELGRGCAASAWVSGLWSDHAVRIGMYPLKAQEEVWGKSPDVPVAAGILPTGKVEIVDGGYVLDGRWPFSSGCDHADWVLIAAPLPGEGGAPGEPYKFLVPRGDYVIEDTWYVTGLAGTGSNDLVLKRVFVPEHRAISFVAMNEGGTPGAAFGEPLHAMPITATVPFLLVAPGVGAAQRLLETFIEEFSTRNARGVALGGLPTIQMRVAEASAEIDAARLLILRDSRDAMQKAIAKQGLTMVERARNRRDMAYASMLAARAADRLFTAMGASGLKLGSAQQRRFHDVRAVAAHRLNSWDISGTTYGQAVFGIEIGFGFA